jgi:hypothetical protein
MAHPEKSRDGNANGKPANGATQPVRNAPSDSGSRT